MEIKRRKVSQAEQLYCRTQEGKLGEIVIDRPLSREEIVSLQSESLTAERICPGGVIVRTDGKPYFEESLAAENAIPADSVIPQ